MPLPTIDTPISLGAITLLLTSHTIPHKNSGFIYCSHLRISSPTSTLPLGILQGFFSLMRWGMDPSWIYLLDSLCWLSPCCFLCSPHWTICFLPHFIASPSTATKTTRKLHPVSLLTRTIQCFTCPIRYTLSSWPESVICPYWPTLCSLIPVFHQSGIIRNYVYFHKHTSSPRSHIYCLLFQRCPQHAGPPHNFLPFKF